MNRIEMNQIIFNALETERSHTKSEAYAQKVEQAMKEFRTTHDPSSGEPRGICKSCGGMDIAIPSK